MGSIVERRIQIEQEVRERGEEFLNDCKVSCKLGRPNWQFYRGYKDPQFNTQYDKNWGHQAVLHISAYTHLPKEERFASHFYLQIAHCSWGAEITSEHYGFWDRREQPGQPNDLFFSVAGGDMPDRLPYLPDRPLTREEIIDVHAVFSQELKDFGGKTSIGRFLTSKSLVWNRGFISAELDRLRDKALEMNDSDLKRYEHQKQKAAELHRDACTA